MIMIIMKMTAETAVPAEKREKAVRYAREAASAPDAIKPDIQNAALATAPVRQIAICVIMGMILTLVHAAVMGNATDVRAPVNSKERHVMCAPVMVSVKNAEASEKDRARIAVLPVL